MEKSYLDNLERLEVVAIPDGEVIDEEILKAYETLFGVLLKSGSIDLLVDQLELCSKLKANDVTCCAVLYLANTYINAFIENFLN